MQKINLKKLKLMLKYSKPRPIYIASKQDNNCFLQIGWNSKRSVRPHRKLSQTNQIAAWKLHLIQGGKILW